MTAKNVTALFGSSYDKILIFHELIVHEGELRGLIGPREIPRIWERHILNSAVLAQFIDVSRGTAYADAGSGRVAQSTDGQCVCDNVPRETITKQAPPTNAPHKKDTPIDACKNKAHALEAHNNVNNAVEKFHVKQTAPLQNGPRAEQAFHVKQTDNKRDTTREDETFHVKHQGVEQTNTGAAQLFHVKQNAAYINDLPQADIVPRETTTSHCTQMTKGSSSLPFMQKGNSTVPRETESQHSSQSDGGGVNLPLARKSYGLVSRETIHVEADLSKEEQRSAGHCVCQTVSRETPHTESTQPVRDTGSGAPPPSTQKVLVDVGSGAGFPGLVLACMLPELEVFLVESMQRRVDWLQYAAAKVGLPNVHVVRARAEEVQKSGEVPPADYVTARAVAPLKKLLGWTMPFLKPGGELIALKGSNVQSEIQEATKIMKRFTKHTPEIIQASVLPNVESTTVLKLEK